MNIPIWPQTHHPPAVYILICNSDVDRRFLCSPLIKKKGGVKPGCFMWVMFIRRRCHHLLTTPSTRIITDRAIWTASDWFQYGSTKSNNEPECQSNQSSRLSLQQPIRSILIKAEEEKERQAPSELRWHGSAWQCAAWILWRTSPSSTWIRRECPQEACADMICKAAAAPFPRQLFVFKLSSLCKPNLQWIYAAFWAQETNEGCQHLNERTWPSLGEISWANTFRKLQGSFLLIINRVNNSWAERGHRLCHHVFTSRKKDNFKLKTKALIHVYLITPNDLM